MEVAVWPPELRVALPEGLELRIRRAGLASRALAWALDAALLVAAMELVAILTFGVGRLSSPLERAILVAVGFVLHWAYGTVAEWRWGTTPGKRLFGLCVIDERGGRPSLRRCFARNLLRTVDVLPGLWLVGGLASWLSREGLRLGDRAAKTYVVCLMPSAVTVNFAAAEAAPRRGHGGAGVAALEAVEVSAIERLCDEREGLQRGVRDGLFEQLGKHVAARTGLARSPHSTWESYLLALRSRLDLSRPVRPRRRASDDTPAAWSG